MNSNLSLIPSTNLTFDFEANPIAEMTLSTLKQTHKEHNIHDEPIMGVHHYEFIERAMALCAERNLSYEIDTIFAAQNRDKSRPGVALLPKVEEVHGKGAVEAHIIRRVFTTIQIHDGATDELTTTLAIAYHQQGIQVAIGPCVRICHNQCILSAESLVSNFGKDKVSTEQLFVVMGEWLDNFHVQMVSDRARIQRMKDRILSEVEILQLIGQLQVARVAHDSKDKSISKETKAYPLNQGQISIFTENLLKLKQTQGLITAWDAYNIATNIYKPGKTNVPIILSQNATLSDMLYTNWAA